MKIHIDIRVCCKPHDKAYLKRTLENLNCVHIHVPGRLIKKNKMLFAAFTWKTLSTDRCNKLIELLECIKDQLKEFKPIINWFLIPKEKSNNAKSSS